MTLAQQKKLNDKRQDDNATLGMIQRRVADSIFLRIMRATKAKEAWEILKQKFQGDVKVRAVKLQTLKRKFENMKMKDNEMLNEYSSRFFELVNQMKTHGEKLSNQRIVEKILISVPKKFDPVMAVIEQTKDLSELGVQELVASLKSYEQRLAQYSEKPIESAFQSKFNIGNKNDERKPHSDEPSKGESSNCGRYGRGRGRGRNSRGRSKGSHDRKSNDEGSSQRCNICKRSNHVENDCWFNGKTQCYHCKKFGHM